MAKNICSTVKPPRTSLSTLYRLIHLTLKTFLHILYFSRYYLLEYTLKLCVYMPDICYKIIWEGKMYG